MSPIGVHLACIRGAAGNVIAPTILDSEEFASTANAATSWAGITPTVATSVDLLLVMVEVVAGDDTALTSISLSSDLDGSLTSAFTPPATGTNPGRSTVGAFYLASPTSGAHVITLTTNLNDTDALSAVAVELQSVDAATPLGANTAADNSENTPGATDTFTGSLTSDKANSRLFHFGHMGILNSGGSALPITWSNSLVSIHDGDTGTGNDFSYGAGSKVVAAVGAASYGMVFSRSLTSWAYGALYVRGAG